jgi:hypothetical protein
MDITPSMSALLSDAPPMGEAGTPAAGTGSQATRNDHRHPRLSSSTSGTTDANGEATIVFTRTFDTQPSVVPCAVENNTNPVPAFKVKAFQTNAGKITGCTIYASRSRALPALGGILLIGPLISALAGFLPSEPAANMNFTIVALQASNV